MLILALSITIATIILQTAWTVLSDRAVTIAQAEKEQVVAVRALEEHAFRTMQDANRSLGATVDAIATAGDTIFADPTALRQLLVREHQGSAHIQSLRFITAAGISTINTFKVPRPPIDVKDRQHIRFMLDHPDRRDSYVGDPVKSRYDGTWVLPVIQNIRSSDGTRVGMLCAYLSLAYFSDFYQRIASARQAMVTLYSERDRIVMRWPDGDRLIGTVITTNTVGEIDRGAREGNLETQQFVGVAQPVILAFRKVAGAPLTVVYALTKADILAPWQVRSQRHLFLSTAVIGLIAVLSFFLLRHAQRLRRSELNRVATENRYFILYESAADAIALINRAHRYVDCNPAALRLFDVARKDQVIGRRVGDFSPARQPLSESASDTNRLLPNFADTDSQLDPAVLIAAAFSGQAQQFEWTTLRDGRLFHNEITLSRGNVDGEELLFAVFRDINERKRSEALHQSQNQILHMISAGVELTSILEVITRFVSRHALETRCMVSMVSEDQRRFDAVIGPDLPAAFVNSLCGAPIVAGRSSMCDAVLSKCPVMTEAQHDSENARLAAIPASDAMPTASSSWPIMGKRGQILGVFSVFLDVPLAQIKRASVNDDLQVIGIATDLAGIAIESRRAEQRIRYLAHYDELTGLPNRSLYTQYLDKALAQAQRHNKQVGVLFLDLDRFKNINDTFGHETGDVVLRDIGVRFVACLREGDIISRVGGDEFIALVENYTDPLELAEIAQRLLDAAAKPFEIVGQECRLGTSIGIATYPLDGNTAQMLLKNADIAMYRAKSTGKNNFQFYSAEMNIHSIERLALESRLRRGIERGEFVMHYQPKIDVNSGDIVGAEALVRWNHPERGLLYPIDFINMAEETGLIGALGMLVLDITCADITRFHDAGANFGRIAINLSGSQFDQANLLHDLIAVVDSWQLDPRCLEFEITESMVMHNREQAIALMDSMMRLGFSLSIDDFGTGYSSLAYLKRFPVDSVKIDKSFINDIPADPNDAAIVRAIIVMAHTLGLKVTAEGVETAIQLATLKGFGCDEYQGYFCSRPVSAQDFIALVHRHGKTAMIA